MGSELYFSQISVDVSDFDWRSAGAVTRHYLEHQIVSDLFGQYHERPFLFRSDFSQGLVGVLLVLSSRPPEFPRPGSPTYGFTRDIRTNPFPTDIRNETKLDFEIRLNATKDVPTGHGKRSKRVDIWQSVMHDAPTDLAIDSVYHDYLQQRLSTTAHVLAAHVTERSFVITGRMAHGKKAISFVATNLIGTLVIRETEGFIGRLKSGFGRSRGFGCGLLCLSRPGTVLPRRYPAILNASASYAPD